MSLNLLDKPGDLHGESSAFCIILRHRYGDVLKIHRKKLEDGLKSGFYVDHFEAALLSMPKPNLVDAFNLYVSALVDSAVAGLVF